MKTARKTIEEHKQAEREMAKEMEELQVNI